ncbi:MAG TPA: dTDP-4-dehydrorhamnose reductase [Terriglobales bacterium]
MRVTIFGATGLLGKALLRQWSGDQITGLGSREADIRDPEQISRELQRARPDWIVLAAAYTDVDGCETNRELAFDVNCRGALNVGQAAKYAGARLLFLSTDYVFDGTKATSYGTNDPRSPQSVYGQSKADAEVELTRILPECCIVRTSWLFGIGGRCFPDTILKLAAQRPELEVVNDQRGSPTYAPDLADAIIQLCRKDATGIVHVTNQGDCTWFDFARVIVASAGLSTTINPTNSDEFIRPARRPAYSVLSGVSLEKYGIAMPTWQDALRRYLSERSTASQQPHTNRKSTFLR